MESPVSGTTLEYMKSHEIVRAGAGAGKTYTLTHKVMDLADAHFKSSGRFPRLIVTTFTRKATQELRERLMLLALEERPHLVDFVNSRSHLVVSTIHGVMDLFLKRYGANICIDPGYRVIGGQEASKLARQILRQVLFDEAEPSDLLESFPFNRLVAIVRRIDRVLAENPNATPFTIDDFETIFTRRASATAELLRESALRIKEETEKDAWLAMAESYLRMASLLSAGDWRVNRERYLTERGAMTVARRASKGAQPVDEATYELAKEARELAAEFADSLFDPDAWTVFSERFDSINTVAKRFSERFRQRKLDEGWLEINDLEHLAMDCIRKHPQTVEAFWREWDHWLVDEYQDTSPFQVELIRRLSGQSPSFVVGDPQQSIYLFRGARSDVFAQREHEILGAGGNRKLLTVNRRSRPELLLFLNDFFGGFTPPFQPMEPFFDGGVELDANQVVAKIHIAQPLVTDEASEIGGGETLDESKNAPEMRAVVRHVQDLIAKGVKPDDICVLGRTNRVLIDAAAWLSRYRLPTHVHAASGFYDRREIRDALALLKFLVNPHDNFNTLELLRSPWFRVPDRVLAPITKKRVESVWDQLCGERSMADELRAIGRLQNLVQATQDEGLSEVFKRGLIEAGFIDLARRHDVSGRRESNIWKLLSRLQQEECQSGFNPLAFVADSVGDLKLDEGNAEGDAVAAIEPDRINLMTVHASKGLEFKHVILPRMEQKPRLTSSEEFTYDEHRGRWALRVPYGADQDMTGSLPELAWLEKFREQELLEHARVLYVALTRASESVFLSWTAPAQTNSWAEMVRLDLEAGMHRTKSYTFEVETTECAPNDAAAIEETAIIPRSPWRPLPEPSGALGIIEGARAEKPMSVTEILASKSGVVLSSENKSEITQRLKLTSRGTAVHRLMELLKYPSREHLRRLVTKWFPEQEDSVLAAVEFVREASVPPLLEIIKNGEVEWGFSIIEDGLLIEGQVDLWGRTDAGEAWIVDYKTGASSLREKAFEQMSLYALAVRKSGLLGPDESLRLAAVYPFSKEIFIADEPSRDRVRRMLKLDE